MAELPCDYKIRSHRLCYSWVDYVVGMQFRNRGLPMGHYHQHVRGRREGVSKGVNEENTLPYTNLTIYISFVSLTRLLKKQCVREFQTSPMSPRAKAPSVVCVYCRYFQIAGNDTHDMPKR